MRRLFPAAVREIQIAAEVAAAAVKIDPNAFDEEAHDPYAEDAMQMRVRRILAHAQAARASWKREQQSGCARWWDISGEAT